MAKHFFFLIHFHIKPFLLYFGYITTGDMELTALVIASDFFTLAGTVIPLLTLLKMTDFPFWISESRTSISESVKLFFLHLDTILITQHSTLPGTGDRKRSLIWYYFGMEIYNPRARSLRFTLKVHGFLSR